MTHQKTQRLFFGWECEISSSYDMPSGRKITPPHMTLVFLGSVSEQDVDKVIEAFVPCPIKVAPCLMARRLIFLPDHKPRVAALCFENIPAPVYDYQKTLYDNIKSLGLTYDAPPFFPHVSILRQPFDKVELEKWFVPQPVLFKSVHLYESIGDLCYTPIASRELIPSFTAIEHTADLAFSIRGQSMQQLMTHASMALCFSHPAFLPYAQDRQTGELSSIIYHLNQQISLMDKEVGCPFKAISYSGKIKQDPDGVLNWEMIIDV